MINKLSRQSKVLPRVILFWFSGWTPWKFKTWDQNDFYKDDVFISIKSQARGPPDKEHIFASEKHTY